MFKIYSCLNFRIFLNLMFSFNTTSGKLEVAFALIPLSLATLRCGETLP
jgi:hypothetical protein